MRRTTVRVLEDRRVHARERKKLREICVCAYVCACLCAYVCVCICVHVFACICVYSSNRPHEQDVTPDTFFNGFNKFEFSFSSSRPVTILGLKSSVCPTILLIAGERIVRFISFLRTLVYWEIRTVSSRIWTRIVFPFPTTISITLRAPLYAYVWFCMLVGWLGFMAYQTL